MTTTLPRRRSNVIQRDFEDEDGLEAEATATDGLCDGDQGGEEEAIAGRGEGPAPRTGTHQEAKAGQGPHSGGTCRTVLQTDR